MRVLIIGTLVLASQTAILVSSKAAQPSFDCSKARTWSELEVCRDDALATLDARLGSLYRERKERADVARHHGLIADQRKWLSQREACKQAPATAQCLKQIYEKRIAELSAKPASRDERTGQWPTMEIGKSGRPDRGAEAEQTQTQVTAAQQPAQTARLEVSTPGDAAQKFAEGKAAYDNNDYVTAFTRFQAAATQGNADAQYYFGYMYRNGLGAPKNDAEGISWMRRSAEQGHAKAQYSLGQSYYNLNPAEAVKWWRKAAEQGEALGQLGLGWAYEFGSGVPRNHAESAKWYRKATDQGNAPAAAALARLLNNPQNYNEARELQSKAINLYKKDVERGDHAGWAAFGLGKLYNDGGVDVPRDFAEAKKWYRQAVDKGNAEATTALAGLEAAEQEEARRRNAAAMADYRRLKDAPVRERMTFVSYGKNFALEAAELTITGSQAARSRSVLRINAVNGEEAEADWPMRLHVSGHVPGNINKPGWYVVYGYLSPDTEPSKRDGLPVPLLSISPAVTCESDECSSLNDLVAIIRLQHDLPGWQPN